MSTSAHSRHLPPQIDHIRIHTTLICLPPASTHQLGLLPDRIAARTARHTNGVPALVSPNHFTIAANLTSRETALLINPHRSPAGTARCAGGPFGLLDFTEFAALTAAVGTGIHTEWEDAVRGTRPAAPWRAYLDLASSRDHLLPGAENADGRGAGNADVVRQERPAGCGSGGAFIGEVPLFVGKVPGR